MNRAEALARVALLGATDQRPALTPEQVGSILDAHRLPDAEGLLPAMEDWQETYDVNGAVAEVWRVKAGLVAADFNFNADGLGVSKGDVMAHFLEMEAQYAARSGTGNLGTIQVVGTNGPFSVVDKVARTVIP